MKQTVYKITQYLLIIAGLSMSGLMPVKDAQDQVDNRQQPTSFIASKVEVVNTKSNFSVNVISSAGCLTNVSFSINLHQASDCFALRIAEITENPILTVVQPSSAARIAVKSGPEWNSNSVSGGHESAGAVNAIFPSTMAAYRAYDGSYVSEYAESRLFRPIVTFGVIKLSELQVYRC